MSGETREEEKAEIAAIFARLKEEIRRGAQVEAERGTRPAGRTLPSRAQADRAWAVTAERPFEHPPTRQRRVQAYVFVPAKRALRKLMRWYVEPLAAQQRSFNLTILTLVDELTERVEADVSRLERRLEALEGQGAPDRAEPSG
jgi:hypothetical protein